MCHFKTKTLVWMKPKRTAADRKNSSNTRLMLGVGSMCIMWRNSPPCSSGTWTGCVCQRWGETCGPVWWCRPLWLPWQSAEGWRRRRPQSNSSFTQKEGKHRECLLKIYKPKTTKSSNVWHALFRGGTGWQINWQNWTWITCFTTWSPTLCPPGWWPR